MRFARSVLVLVAVCSLAHAGPFGRRGASSGCSSVSASASSSCSPSASTLVLLPSGQLAQIGPGPGWTPSPATAVSAAVPIATYVLMSDGRLVQISPTTSSSGK